MIKDINPNRYTLAYDDGDQEDVIKDQVSMIYDISVTVTICAL